ncbi:hypothetical protein [Mycoplasma sp. ATU-Cv-703]|uniref:hypothetical protein n=1 Tax=Mycoplasma sp. ATU-Cv-703 TaxID=2498595 RepID=UPI000FDE6645
MNDYKDFIQSVDPQHRDSVQKTHDALLAAGFKIAIENKASGFFVTYKNPKTKRILPSFLFRKSGLLPRLYSENPPSDVLDNLTAEMEKEIDKAPACKYCSEKCAKGYKFTIRGTAHDKCRFNAFLFSITEKSTPLLSKWIQHEIGGTR